MAFTNFAFFGAPALFLLMSAPGFAFASLGVDTDSVGSCDSVDYTAQIPPVRDQGESNFCYAYVAADLVSQRLHVAVSALAAANTTIAHSESYFTEDIDHVALTLDLSRAADQAVLKSYRDILDDAIKHRDIPFELQNDGGQIDEAVTLLGDYGVCYEKDAPSDKGFDSVTGRAALVRATKRMHVVHQSSYQTAHPFARANVTDGQLGEAWQAEFRDRCRVYIPALPFHPNNVAINDTVNKGVLVAPADQKQRVLDQINAGLDLGRIVGVSVDGNILDDTAKDEKSSEDAENHALSIVQRVCDSSCACKYRVRNSWDKNSACARYPTPFSLDCKDGMFWLTADQVRQFINQAVYIN